LKLFGVQFYLNTAYVYRFSKPCNHSYVFSLDFSFAIPTHPSNPGHSLPKFIKNIYVLNEVVKDSNAALDQLFKIDASQEILSDNNDLISPDGSPHRQTRKRKLSNDDDEE
jgi:hypothetical protein